MARTTNRLLLVPTLAAALWAGRPAGADTVLKGAAGTNPIALSDVKVTGVSNGELTYTTNSGSSRSAPLTDVQKVTVDGQPAFNAAEDAYASNPAGSLDGYLAATTGAGPDWLKARAAQRLATVARGQHRYDAGVAAYAALLKLDPNLAAAARPSAPAANDPNLDRAATVLSQSMATAPSAAKPSLLGVQLDIARARGDKAGVNAALQQLVSAGGASPAQQAMLKLAAAEVALDSKQYALAESDITASKALFTDAGQQVDALWVLAAARDGAAGAAVSGDAAKDVALAYMRVVAFGGQLPDRPHVADALVRAAQLEEKLSDPKAAATLYQQALADRAAANTPAADAAAKGLARVKK